MNSAGTVVQATNYYPSGTTMADYPRATTQGVQPYKFGGKELDRKDNLNFYDYEARAYDPALMRFTSTDPMMEKYYGWSPFAYCGNNPVRFVDPDGRDPKNWRHWVQFGKDLYNATSAVITGGLEVAGKIELNNVVVGADVNLIATDIVGTRDGKFTPSKDTPQIRQGVELGVGVAGVEISKSVTDNGNSTTTVKEKIAASVLVFEASSETTTVMKETKGGEYIPIKSTTENSVKTSDLNVKAAVILGVEINLDVNKAWDALRDLLLEK
jgi:RHS repeat-associated protein